jgi:sugar lactone lactonase YvrE
MHTPPIRLFADARNQLGEGPLWCPERQCLWWIDVASPALLRAAEGEAQVSSWSLPKPPGSIARIDADRLVIAFRSGLALAQAPDWTPQWTHPAAAELGEERFNDGKVDRAGRYWLGTMDRKLKAPLGALYCLDGASMRQADKGFILSNGIGWSPDNRVLYFSDTFARCIHAYDFDLERGTVANRRVFVQFEDGPGGPDGLTVDAEGFVWSVVFERSAVHRYRPDGALDQVLRLPVSRPTSCTFGGADLRTLYITSARIGLDADALESEPWAGGVLAVDLPCQGLPEPRYRPR